IVASGRQFRIITKHLADFKNSRGRATVAFFFAKTGLILTGQPRAPGNAIFAKQNRKLTRNGGPTATASSLKQLKFAVHRIPIRRDPKNKLRAIARHAIGMYAADKGNQRAARKCT